MLGGIDERIATMVMRSGRQVYELICKGIHYAIAADYHSEWPLEMKEFYFFAIISESNDMARTGRPALQKGQKRSIPRKTAAKQSAKGGKAVLDVYEYSARGNKKANKRIQGDAQEKSKGKGRAVDDGDDDESDMDRPAYTLGGGSDVEFHSSQDEEIDSDMADTSGEEDNSTSKSKPKRNLSSQSKRQSANEIDLDEEQDLSNSEDGEDYVDLSTMLDRPSAPAPSDSSEGESGSDSEDQESDALSISEDENAEDAAEKLQSLINALPQQPGKRPSDGDASVTSKKRRKVMDEQTEAWEENQFASMGVKGEGLSAL
ncbi:Hypothetical predicted protein [Olea europaea subsp. europaea]|uniref:Uncharacterized protein n=1 Tax=Olea europaea subsp. europaea TaxID=158383 RepID=A0A8S0RDI2_OLEEU|nr:Hypothetical predicted protein [Olea europaea subsp. europaea]